MPVINLMDGFPGMRSVLATRPDVYKAICELSQLVLVGPDEGITPEPARTRLGELTLTQAEREIIGTYVSKLNECKFCTSCHEVLAQHFADDKPFVDACLGGHSPAPRFRALLEIAHSVQARVQVLDQKLVDEALTHGATQADVYDTVVLASAFCMFNRMVECLGTEIPAADSPYYASMIDRVEKAGYRYYK